MFFSHCLQLLETGGSRVRQDQINDVSSVIFRLSAGVRIKRLDSIKTSLLMIEAIKLSWDRCEYGSCTDDSLLMFDNFVAYTYTHFSPPIAMAIIKYAFKDRKLEIRNASSSRNWGIVEQSFRGPLLDKVHTEADIRLAGQFDRCYNRLRRCVAISNCLSMYIKTELSRFKETSVLALDRHLATENC